MTSAPPTSLDNSIMGIDGLEEKNDLGHHSDDKLASSNSAGRESPILCSSGEGHSQTAGHPSKEMGPVENISPGRVSSVPGAELDRNSERDMHSPYTFSERLSNLGHFEEADNEVLIIESEGRDGQKFKGSCQAGEETRSGIYGKEASPRSCPEEHKVQVSKAVENREEHTRTLRLRESPEFCGVTSLTCSRYCSPPLLNVDELGSRVTVSEIIELSALSGFRVTGSHATTDIEMAEKPLKMLTSEALAVSLDKQNPTQAKSWDLFPFGESVEALFARDAHHVRDFRQQAEFYRQSGSPLAGVEITEGQSSSISTTVSDLVSVINNPLATIGQPFRKPTGFCITASDLAETLQSAETHNIIISEIFKQLTSSWGLVRTSPSSWLMESLIKQHREAGPLHVWVSGSPQHNQQEQHNNEGGDNQNPEGDLDEYLAYMDPNDPPEFVVTMLKGLGFPVPGDPGYKSWLEQYKKSRRLTPAPQPEELNPSRLELSSFDVDIDLSNVPDLDVEFLEVLDEASPIRKTTSPKVPQERAQNLVDGFDSSNIPDMDLDAASPIRKSMSPNFKVPQKSAQNRADDLVIDLLNIPDVDVDSLGLQDLGMGPVGSPIRTMVPPEGVHGSGQNDIDDDDNRNTNIVHYSETLTTVDLEKRESYNKQILRWTRLLLAIKTRPTWWDQPDRGERLVGLIQELQRDSVQAFAQIDATPGTRTPPNIDLAQKLGQDLVPSSNVQFQGPGAELYTEQEEDSGYFQRMIYNADETGDLGEMRDMLKRLDDMRGEPPQFQDAESHRKFASTIGTFYSVLIQTIERIYGNGAKDVLIDELLKFRDQFPNQGFNNVPTHEDFYSNFKDRGFESFDTDINVDSYDIHDTQEEAQETTLETRRRQRSQDPENNQERAKKAARDTTQQDHPATDTLVQLPHLQKAPNIVEKLISSSILEWMKGLYIMRSKAARFSPTNYQLSSALLAPQLRAFYLDVLISGEATFDATISDVTDEKCKSTREEYRQRISRNPKVADQVAKQMSGEVNDLVMDDELKLVAWMVQYLNMTTVLRNMAAPPNPLQKLKRSALLRAFLEELRETASSILEAEDMQAFEVPTSALSAAREAAQKYHDKFVLRAQEQQKKQEEKSRLKEQRRKKREPKRATNLPRQGNVGARSAREEEAPEVVLGEDDTPVSPLRPPSSPLKLPDEEVRKLKSMAERRKIADDQFIGTFRTGWNVKGLAVPRAFTRADMAHYEEYLSLTYKELERLMTEIACALMGRSHFATMRPKLNGDLQFYLTAYYRLAAGQVDHSEPTCDSSRSPLDCCYTKKFGTSLLEADRENRHKILIDQFIRDIFQRMIRYCKMANKEITRVPDVICRRLMEWLAEYGYDLDPEKIKKLSGETGLEYIQIKKWINQSMDASVDAAEAARQNEAEGAPPGSRPLPVDTSHHSNINGRVRHILKHWVEQHHEYPFTIRKEEKELAELTGLDKNIIRRFFIVYRNNNKHRLNMEYDLNRHNALNRAGHGRDLEPRYRLVGAKIEIPEPGTAGRIQPPPPPSIPAPSSIPPTVAAPSSIVPTVPSSVEDDWLDTDPGAEDEGKDEEVDKGLHKEIAKALGKKADSEREGTVDTDSDGSSDSEEDGDEEEVNYETMIESQLDILRQHVQEGKMTLEEAQAVAAEGVEREGGEGMNDDERALEGIVLDEAEVALLPQLTEPGIKQKWRQVIMLGGSKWISKRWRPSPSVQANLFDLVGRAKEQTMSNVGPKIGKVAWKNLVEDIKLLITAHQNFATGIRSHCKITCNLEDDPGPCCYNDRFGSIDHISGANDRLIASLPMFDVDITRLGYTFLNNSEESKSWTRWSIPFEHALEIEKWIVERRRANPGEKMKFPSEEEYGIWEKKLGLPKRQAFSFIKQWRQKCLPNNKEGWAIPPDVRIAVHYFRNWFEENLDNPYLNAEQAAPYCEKFNISLRRVRNILSNIRRENKHRISEEFYVENQLQYRYRETREGDELIRGRFYYREVPPP